MFTHLKRFWNDESGPELVEWAVVTIILLVAAVVLYVAVGQALGGVICSIYCWLDKVKKGEVEVGQEPCQNVDAGDNEC